MKKKQYINPYVVMDLNPDEDGLYVAQIFAYKEGDDYGTGYFTNYEVVSKDPGEAVRKVVALFKRFAE